MNTISTISKIRKYTFSYEIQKGLHITSTGTCSFHAVSEEIALRNAENEINRRFKGALNIVIYPVKDDFF